MRIVALRMSGSIMRKLSGTSHDLSHPPVAASSHSSESGTQRPVLEPPILTANSDLPHWSSESLVELHRSAATLTTATHLLREVNSFVSVFCGSLICNKAKCMTHGTWPLCYIAVWYNLHLESRCCISTGNPRSPYEKQRRNARQRWEEVRRRVFPTVQLCTTPSKDLLIIVRSQG